MSRRPGPPPGAPDGPRPLAESLRSVTARLKRPDLDQLGTVIRRWEEIAGPTLSSHAQPVRLGDGVMVVAVDQPAWATQVRALSGALVTRIGEVTGHFPDRLEVVVRRR